MHVHLHRHNMRSPSLAINLWGDPEWLRDGSLAVEFPHENNYFFLGEFVRGCLMNFRVFFCFTSFWGNPSRSFEGKQIHRYSLDFPTPDVDAFPCYIPTPRTPSIPQRRNNHASVSHPPHHPSSWSHLGFSYIECAIPTVDGQ